MSLRAHAKSYKCIRMSFCIRGRAPTLLLITCISVWGSSIVGAPAEKHRAICPTPVIEAKEGDDVFLPCYVDPPVDLSACTMDWTRTNPNKMVYSYRNKQEHHDAEMKATVRREDLYRGNLALWIPSVQLAYSGSYTGFILDFWITCVVQLNVTREKQKKPEGHDGFNTTGTPVNTTEKVEPGGDMVLILGIVLPLCILFLLGLFLSLMRKLEEFVRKFRGWIQPAEDDLNIN